MAALASPAASKTLVDCPKCDGKGRILGFGHVCSGICFECGGSRKVEVDALELAEINQAKISQLYHTAEVVMGAVSDGNEKRAEFYMGHMVADMLAVGTEAARGVLECIRQGRWEDYNTMRQGRLDQVTAAKWMNRLIELGREAKAA